MKILVETPGDFMLIDTSHFAQEIQPDRPSVVDNTNFISGRVSLGQVKILGELTEAATDTEFQKFFEESKGDSNLAVESFLSTFGVEQITQKAPKAGK
jgi:hypothetical protein